MTFIIIITAFLASLLTLFSGFGLGTLLMPVVAIFFPVAIAIALTTFIAAATVAAFAGVLVGKASSNRVTIGMIQKLVAFMLLSLGVLLTLGII